MADEWALPEIRSARRDRSPVLFVPRTLFLILERDRVLCFDPFAGRPIGLDDDRRTP